MLKLPFCFYDYLSEQTTRNIQMYGIIHGFKSTNIIFTNLLWMFWQILGEFLYTDNWFPAHSYSQDRQQAFDSCPTTDTVQTRLGVLLSRSGTTEQQNYLLRRVRALAWDQRARIAPLRALPTLARRRGRAIHSFNHRGLMGTRTWRFKEKECWVDDITGSRIMANNTGWN